jgi:hypothetical protein
VEIVDGRTHKYNSPCRITNGSVCQTSGTTQ